MAWPLHTLDRVSDGIVLPGWNLRVHTDGRPWAVMGDPVLAHVIPHGPIPPSVMLPLRKSAQFVRRVFIGGRPALFAGDLAACGCASKAPVAAPSVQIRTTRVKAPDLP